MSLSPESPDARAHVIDQVREFCHAQLTPLQTRAIEAHLVECQECAADYAWARSFVADAETAALRHLASERLLNLGEEANPTTEESLHLEACAECSELLSWSAALSAEPETRREEVAGLRARLQTRWTGATERIRRLRRLLSDRDSPTTWARFACVEPIPVRIHRGRVEPGSFEESWLRGLEAYSSRDFAAAAIEFERAEEMQPGRPEVSLYLGSARLLLGDSARAISFQNLALERLKSLEDAQESVAQEARWQLANAHLVIGDAKQAKMLLRALLVIGGNRAGAARDLLERLSNARPD